MKNAADRQAGELKHRIRGELNVMATSLQLLQVSVEDAELQDVIGAGLRAADKLDALLAGIDSIARPQSSGSDSLDQG